MATSIFCFNTHPQPSIGLTTLNTFLKIFIFYFFQFKLYLNVVDLMKLVYVWLRELQTLYMEGQPTSLHTNFETFEPCHFIFNTHPYNDTKHIS